MVEHTRFKRDVADWGDSDWNILQYDISDSFTPGQPVSETDLFAGRKKEIHRLVETVLDRGKHAIIYGERGIGKTSLSNVFYKMVDLPVMTIKPIKERAVEDNTFLTLWERIFRKLGFTSDIRSWIGPDYGDPLSRSDIIDRLMAYSTNQIIIIIIDEFDRLEDRPTSRSMASLIKDMEELPSNFTIVLVGAARSIDALLEGHGSLERALRQIEMPRMTSDELRDVVTSRLSRTPMSITSDTLWQICVLSRGLPYYTHSLGKFAAINAIKRKSLRIEGEDLDSAVERTIEEIEHSLRHAYTEAVKATKKENTYKEVFLAAALAHTDDLGRFAAADVEAPISHIMNEEYRQQRFHGILNAFTTQNRGAVLLKEGARGTYRFSFSRPVMQPYVVLQGLKSGLITKEGVEQFMLSREPRFSTEF